jgi:hypothetical protein
VGLKRDAGLRATNLGGADDGDAQAPFDLFLQRLHSLKIICIEIAVNAFRTRNVASE